MTMTRSNEDGSRVEIGTAVVEGKRRSVREGSWERFRSSQSDSMNSTEDGAVILA